MYVGINGIVALLLQFVSRNFVHQADTSTLLLHVNKHAATFFFYKLQSVMQLIATVATHASDDVARSARRVNAHQHRVVIRPFAFGKGKMFEPITDLPERRKLKMSVFGRHINGVSHFNKRFGFQPIGYHIFDADKLEIVLLRHFLQFGQACHRSIFVHYLH